LTRRKAKFTLRDAPCEPGGRSRSEIWPEMITIPRPGQAPVDTSRGHVLVLRFGALGDLVLSTALLPGLMREGVPVIWVTKTPWAALLRHDERIAHLVTLGSGDSLRDLARRLEEFDVRHVVDAHSNLRSRVLTALLPPLPVARLQKDTLARWLHVAGLPASRALERRLVDRMHDLVPASKSTDRPRIVLGTQAVARASGCFDKGTQRWLAVAPGAKHAAKQWPAERFAAVARAHVARTGCGVMVMGGPDEHAAMKTVCEGVPGARAWPVDRPLDEVAAALARCDLLLGNDSGLVHLAEAVGTPAVAVFGPTVRAWGYFPLDRDSRVVEQDVPCRPCSKAGERACRQPEAWCLTRSTVDDVLEAVEESWNRTPANRIPPDRNAHR